MNKDTTALLSIDKLGSLNKNEAKKIAKWLMVTASAIEMNHKQYSATGPCRFRLMKK